MGNYDELIEVFNIIDRGKLKASDKREVKSSLVTADSALKDGDIKEFCDYAQEAIDFSSDCPKSYLAIMVFLGKLAERALKK